MLLTFQFKYSYNPSDEEFAKLKAIIPDIERTPDGDEWQANCVKTINHVGDIKKVLGITNEIELQQEPISHTLQLAEKIEEMAVKIDRYSAERQFNERVSVHVPGFSLMEIKEAYVEVDLCTESLNDRLSEGWRILAICPQPDQRRPDYIFGKS